MLQDHNRYGNLVTVPLKGPVEIHTVVRAPGIGLGEVMLDFVHPKAIAVAEFDPAWLKADIHDYKLHRVFAKQVSNVGRGQRPSTEGLN